MPGALRPRALRPGWAAPWGGGWEARASPAEGIATMWACARVEGGGGGARLGWAAGTGMRDGGRCPRRRGGRFRGSAQRLFDHFALSEPV